MGQGNRMIPEMAIVGLTEQQAIKEHGGAMVGTVDFSRLARAHIMAAPAGIIHRRDAELPTRQENRNVDALVSTV